MRNRAGKALAAAIIVAEIAAMASTTVSAQPTARERSEIRRQQQLILRQQREIDANQRRIESQREHIVRSPVTGEAIDESKLPKGLLSGVLPACPLGFAYNPFTGCVLYVAH